MRLLSLPRPTAGGAVLLGSLLSVSCGSSDWPDFGLDCRREPDSGLEVCEGGEGENVSDVYRVATALCQQRTAGADNCGCTDGTVCVTGAVSFTCIYTCATDGDCAPNQICSCDRRGFGECLLAECRTDADCGDGRCALSESVCPYGGFFTCRTPSDACVSDAQCDEGFECVADLGDWQCLDRVGCE